MLEMNHYVVLKANCKYRFLFFSRIPFYAQAPVARNHHPPFFLTFCLGHTKLISCSSNRPHVKRLRQELFFLFLHLHQSRSRPHLFRYLQNKIFNLLSAFMQPIMQWFLSIKTIVIEKIVHSNTIAEVFVASVVSPVKILLCNTGGR